MSTFEIVDALTGDLIAFDQESGNATIERGYAPVEKGAKKTLFFPGCSFVNYAMPLVQAVHGLLEQQGVADGISVLCCGKILSYEPEGDVLRASFEDQLKDHIARAGVEKLICACPNCVMALRNCLSADERTKDVQIEVLPQTLADLGYRLDPATCAKLIKGSEDEDVLLCTHDSCPDGKTGEFARGLRALMPDGLWADPEHCLSKSICCGSLPRAAGKFEQADKCAMKNGEEAKAIGADAIVTACMSCTFQLNMAQPHVQCVNYLELLFNWRVDWATVGAWMKLRFLFDETLGCEEKAGGSRPFAGLSSSCEAAASASGTRTDEEACEQELHGKLTEEDGVASKSVSISNADVKTLGE
ncbi:MAG: hypothetical protein HFJ65_01995 [Eggerthellaceae bacterium]|nr:hypothetical protein [Eggerthellaceae bacterium]